MHKLLVRSSFALAVLAMVAVLGLQRGGTALAGAPGRPAVTLTITDSSLSIPATVPAGYTAITIVNNGTIPHEASFVRVNTGVTIERLIAAAQASINSQDPADFVAFLQVAQFYGGVSGVEPGTSNQVVLNLTPGTYAVADTAGFQEGLFASFTVAGPPSDVAPPLADATITQRDFAFDAPATIPAGTRTLEVRNTGAQSHELHLAKLDPGHTLQDVLEAVQQSGPDTPPPPWAHDVTSVDAQGPGLTQWVTLNLTPGTYAMLCFLPDVITERPHALEGMVNSFTVQ
jgi:hypothetical protein